MVFFFKTSSASFHEKWKVCISGVSEGSILHMTQFISTHWSQLLEVLLTGVCLLVAWSWLRKASGVRMLAEIALVIAAVTMVAHLLGLELLRILALFTGLCLVVVFQPEVRRALVSLGSHQLFSTARDNLQLVEALSEAAQQLSAKRFGALFAFERGMDLDQFAETGVEVDAKFSPELVMTLFHPKTILHDGGMLLRQGRIVAAGCVFPVSQKEMSDRSIGLRHRAGIGITEQTDAIAVCVSEETGNISICADGEIEQALSPEAFVKLLSKLLATKGEHREKERESSADRSATQRLEA